MITAIKLIDEHFDLRRRITEQKNKLEDLSNKFKELKSLAIKYKDVKEIEIKDLNIEINNIKKISKMQTVCTRICWTKQPSPSKR